MTTHNSPAAGRQSRKHRRPWIIIVVSLFAVAATVLRWQFSVDPDSLIHQAKPMGSIQLPANVYYATYAWAPKGEVRILCWTGPNGTPVVSSYNEASGSLLWSRSIRGIDLRGMSPDGKWLLYDLGEHFGSGLRKAAATDGTGRQTWAGVPFNGTAGTVWNPDGSAFLECGGRSGTKLAKYSFSKSTPTVIDLHQRVGIPVWYSSQEQMLSYDYGPGYMGARPRKWYLTDLRSSPTVRSIDYPFTKDKIVATVRLSPSEQWLVWSFVIYDERPRWVDRILTTFSKSVPGQPHPARREVWVSRLDGSQAREIGRVRLRGWQDAVSVEWDRTGDNICFIKNRQIYRIPFAK